MNKKIRINIQANIEDQELGDNNKIIIVPENTSILKLKRILMKLFIKERKVIYKEFAEEINDMELSPSQIVVEGYFKWENIDYRAELYKKRIIFERV